MPSGHEVCAEDIIIVSLYSMGRTKDVWGEDCQEYRPERWLSEDGSQLRYVPSHKFLAFNSGPRMCLGKDIAIIQMKTIVAAIVWNFDMEMLDGQAIEPKLSCLLQMKNGLKLKVQKREM
jgi:cytochrome P450